MRAILYEYENPFAQNLRTNKEHCQAHFMKNNKSKKAYYKLFIGN